MDVGGEEADKNGALQDVPAGHSVSDDVRGSDARSSVGPDLLHPDAAGNISIRSRLCAVALASRIVSCRSIGLATGQH